MSMNLNPVILAGEAIHTSDKNLSGSTIAAVVFTGIAVVFIALILLIMLVSLYGKIFDSVNKKNEAKAAAAKKAETAKKAEPPAPKTAPKTAPVVSDGIEEETVAVIMAAIAAYGAQSGKKLAVKSIKASQGGAARRNAWSAAGISEATRPF